MRNHTRWITLAALIAAVTLHAQDRDKRIAPIQVGQRVALIIGNSNYQFQPSIPQAVNDAKDMEDVLKASGFTVTVLTNTRIGDLDRKLDDFYRAIQPGALALFYYSGHGGSLGEENYLLPVEFQQQDFDSGVARTAVAMSTIRNSMESRGARVRLLIFDACRNAALVRAKDLPSGFVETKGKVEGTVVAYASAHGQVSRFREAARNSYYTAALLARLRNPATDLKTLLEDTATDVYAETGGTQAPYNYGQLFGKLYLGKVPSLPNPSMSNTAEESAWRAVENSGDEGLFEAFLKEFPSGLYAGAARIRLAALKRAAAAAPSTNPTPPPVVVEQPRGRQPGEKRVNPKDGATYVWIPPGTFPMGCSPGDSECYGDEKPPVEVTLTKGYWLGETEVTQDAYQKVTGSNPSDFKGIDKPVETVSWNEAQAYCKQIGGRLPTEAEWERAARGGRSDARYGDVDGVGWYDKNSGNATHAVKGKQVNAYGLYDMLGNVWEWTNDWYGERLPGGTDPAGPSSGQQRVLRGGSWINFSWFLRASLRDRFEPSVRNNAFGFRCAWE